MCTKLHGNPPNSVDTFYQITKAHSLGTINSLDFVAIGQVHVEIFHWISDTGITR